MGQDADLVMSRDREGAVEEHRRLSFIALGGAGQVRRFCGISFSLDSAGINRREVVNERVIQERSSDHPDPEPCEGAPQGRT